LYGIFHEEYGILRDLFFNVSPLNQTLIRIFGVFALVNNLKIYVIFVSRFLGTLHPLTAHAFTPDNLVRSIKEGAASYLPKEEIGNITTFLSDILTVKETGKNPWGVWQDRLPTSYFERRWGVAWQDADKDFWEKFRAGIKARTAK